MNLRKKLKTFFIVTLVPGILLAAQSRTLSAERYLRICKNGVTYYYFSQKSDNQTEDRFRKTANLHNLHFPLQKKLSSRELEPVIREAAIRHKLPPSLVKAVIRVESNFQPAATSPKGAQGLMQLMPETARDLQVANPYDVRENIWGGTRYLRMLLEKFNYRLHLALAAYNAGPQKVQQCHDVPSIKETQDFVRDVCTNFLKYHGEEGIMQ
jgi:soluble lytic murein transglycosylase-like protein